MNVVEVQKSRFHEKIFSHVGRVPLWGHGSELLGLRSLWHWLKSVIFWVVTPCSSERTQHFGGAYHLYLHGWRVSQAKINQNISFLPVSAVFLLNLLFVPECADDTFHNTVLSPKYTVCYNPEDCALHGTECFTSQPAANCHTFIVSFSVWMNYGLCRSTVGRVTRTGTMSL